MCWRLSREVVRQKMLRQSERQGRIRAEKKLASAAAGGGGLNSVGIVESVFQKRAGTPRQPGLVDCVESTIVVDPSLVQGLDALGEFSHVWIMFSFHANTNMGKKLFQRNPFDGLKLLVEPPKAQGRKVGVFACRTPHRPNPIGLSLCKIIKIKKNRLVVAGLDCLNQTPVVDIKPYLPIHECVPDAIAPEWIFQGVWEEEFKVEWQCDISSMDTKIRQIVEKTLASDIRSVHQIKNINGGVYEFLIDEWIVKYTVDDFEKLVVIVWCCLNGKSYCDGVRTMAKLNHCSQDLASGLWVSEASQNKIPVVDQSCVCDLDNQK